MKFLALRDEKEQEVEIANTVEDKVAAAIPEGFCRDRKENSKFKSQKMEIKLELVSVSWYEGKCQPPKRERKMAKEGGKVSFLFLFASILCRLASLAKLARLALRINLGGGQDRKSVV